MIARLLLSTALALACTLPAARASATSDASQSFGIHRSPAPPAVESGPGPDQWQSALHVDDFFNLTARKTAALPTVAYLTYDERNLYVGFDVEQSGLPIHATQTTNNVGFGVDDFVGIGIDTSGNGSRVMFFETTPLGTRYQQSSESSRFDPAWKANARLGASNWTATMVIPLSALGVTGSASSWRFNFVRSVAAVNERYTWAYNPLMFDNPPPAWPSATDARYWPKLVGVHVEQRMAKPPASAAIYGLESLGRDRTQFPQANGRFGPQPVRVAGIDAVYPFTSSARFVGTFHPDFSNVEVDQQTIAPQQFQRNLSEYRPFFVRGAQYLHPNVFPGVVLPVNQIFYTPAVGVFNSGLKIEGTQGFGSFGLLDARGNGFDDTAYGYKYGLPDRSLQIWSDGAIARDAHGVDSTAELGTEVRNVKSGFITGFNQAAEWGTFVPSATLARSTNIFIDSQKPNFETYFGYRDDGPYYNPRKGFIVINDIRGYESYFNFFGNAKAGSVIKTRGFFFAGDRFTDRSGAVRQVDFNTNVDVLFTNLVHVSLNQATSETRSYDAGYPFYSNGLTQRFNQSTVLLGYREQSDSPVTASFSAGPFGGAYIQQYTFNTTRQLGTSTSVLFGYGATRQRNFTGAPDGQYLRRIVWSRSLGPDSSVTLAYRDISGSGGYATPGANFAALYHKRFANRNDIYVSFGTPAAPTTLNRFIVKYVWQLGNFD
ncbi:MAG: hypothetical protein M3Z41_04040 [Candidatus Eremiobacteraeota bacterium]|nr:hypothetical protein [Candidatus Eremiobacteraeota bacterium]